jgi:hypothetical protein
MTVPIDPGHASKGVEVEVQICSMPEPGDAVASWLVELHTEALAPAASGGSCKGDVLEPAEDVPKEVFHAEAFFPSAGAALTHIKSRCETLAGRNVTKAVKVPEALIFMPGDRAQVEIRVYANSPVRVVPPSVKVFQEPVSAASSESSGLAGQIPTHPMRSRSFGFWQMGRIPTRPIGL